LYHRLSTVVISLPPLRQRRSDIAELSVALLRRIRDEVGAKALTSGALAQLASYDWPGNVRELASVLYRAAMAAPTSEVAASHVLLPRSGEQSPRLASLGAHDADSLLRENAGNISRAARAAGVPRSTFRSWLAKAQPNVPPRGNGKLAG
jgi:DNA-binding NtrC family response regulator